MKKLLLTLGIAFSIWGGNSWAITLTWSDNNTTATLSQDNSWGGDIAKWLNDTNNVAEVEKATTLVIANGIHFNNDDVTAINKLKGNIKYLDINAHQGNANIPIDNINFECIDYTDLDSWNKLALKGTLVKCNEKQIVAYPYPVNINGKTVDVLFVECNAGKGNQGFIAKQKAFFEMVYGKTNVSKVVVMGEINKDDLNAISKSQTAIINLDEAIIPDNDVDFSNSQYVKYILGPKTWANDQDSINTKLLTNCPNLLAACAVSSDNSKLVAYCPIGGHLHGAVNMKNYPKISSKKSDGNTDECGKIRTAIIGGHLNHTDIALCDSLRELNLAQAIIANDSLFIENNGSGAILEKVILPTDTSYTKIKDQAFTIAPNLKEVIFPKNLKEIGAYAFKNCANLPSFLDLVNTHIETIGEGAFQNCKQIQYIRFPESLKRIEAYAFQWHDCEVLRIPRNVEYIGTEAFRSSAGTEASGGTDGEEQLKDVYFQGTEAPSVEKNAFGEAAYTGNHGYAAEKIYGEYSTRANYINGKKWFAVLHYRPDLTKDQEAKYVDITRVYYFKDLYLGDQRHWPTQIEFNQAYGENCKDRPAGNDPISHKDYPAGTFGILNGKHFDGTDLTEDEKTRIGIYQFVLTRNDAPIPDLKEPDKPDFPLNISDDDWWTICLPFSLNKNQVKNIFGEDTKLYTLNKVTRDKTNNKIRLYFDKDVMDGNKGGEIGYGGKQLYDGYEGTGIKAWYPYVIKPSKDFGGTAAVVENYRIEAGSERDVVIKAKDEYSDNGGDHDKIGYGWYYVFRGNCSGIISDIQTQINLGIAPQSLIYRPDNCYFMGFVGGKAAFLYQHDITEHKPFSPYTCAIMAYMYDGSSDKKDQIYHFIDDSFVTPQGAKVHEAGSLMEFEDTTTPVENVEIVTPDQVVNGNIYNLNGQLVKENATSLDGLSKGIYIMNGKKFIVK